MYVDLVLFGVEKLASLPDALTSPLVKGEAFASLPCKQVDCVSLRTEAVCCRAHLCFVRELHLIGSGRKWKRFAHANRKTRVHLLNVIAQLVYLNTNHTTRTHECVTSFSIDSMA